MATTRGILALERFRIFSVQSAMQMRHVSSSSDSTGQPDADTLPMQSPGSALAVACDWNCGCRKNYWLRIGAENIQAESVLRISVWLFTMWTFQGPADLGWSRYGGTAHNDSNSRQGFKRHTQF